MAILLSKLVSRLQADIPARNNVPSDAQYEQAALNAVRDFGRRCGQEKVTDLTIVANTADYALPDDFVKLIKLSSLSSPNGVWISSTGIIPLPHNLQPELITIRNNVLTIKPTPTYSLERGLRYKAGWAISGDGEDRTFADMGEAEADIVLLMASADCMSHQLNVEGGGVLSYRIGDESFDKSGGVQSKTGERDGLLKQYKDACELYNGQATSYGAAQWEY